jgi:hypothetical protein
MSHKTISISSPATAVIDSPPMMITAARELGALGAGDLAGAGAGCGWDWMLRSKARPSTTGAGCGSKRRIRPASGSTGDMPKVGKLCGDGGLAGGLAGGGGSAAVGALF